MLSVAGQAGEEVVRGQVLERVETVADCTDVVRRERPAVAVETLDRLADAEVARGPGSRAREVPRQEPVGGPLADPGQFCERRLDLLVGKEREACEVEVAACETDHVLS